MRTFDPPFQPNLTPILARIDPKFRYIPVPDPHFLDFPVGYCFEIAPVFTGGAEGSPYPPYFSKNLLGKTLLKFQPVFVPPPFGGFGRGLEGLQDWGGVEIGGSFRVCFWRVFLGWFWVLFLLVWSNLYKRALKC